MAIPIRGLPVLEGDIARRFIKEAKANEKKQGTHKLSEETIAACKALIERAKKLGTIPF
jgi:hypothetical protein